MSDSKVIEEGFELNRALREIRSLRIERQQNLNALLADIERALQTGKLTCRRKQNTERHTLSKRAVATLQLQASQLRRNLFFIMERERQILQRLAAIGDSSDTSRTPPSDGMQTEAEERAATRDVSSEESGAGADEISDEGTHDQSA